MFGFEKWLYLAGGAFLAASVTIAVYTVKIVPAAVETGRKLERAATMAAALDAIKERNSLNEQISKMPDSGLCVALGGVWLPNEKRCE